MSPSAPGDALLGRPRVGLDIGGTKIHAVALGPDLEVLAEQRVPTGHGPDQVVRNAAEITLETITTAGLTTAEIGMVGVGIPGAVDHRTGFVRQALNLGLAELMLGSELGAAVGLPVHVENDVNAAALGVALGFDDGAAHDRRAGSESLGRSRPHRTLAPGRSASLAYLNLGTGLAAGLVLEGRLWRGDRGAAGEIGHVPLDQTGPPCHCGQNGCLETMASGSGIMAQWVAERGDTPFSVRQLPELALTDPLAARIQTSLDRAVAACVRLLVLTADVENVVIGGGVAKLGTALLTRVLQVLRDWEQESAFLASLAPSSRVTLLRQTGPVAAIGAALAGRLPCSASAGAPPPVTGRTASSAAPSPTTPQEVHHA